MPSCANQFVDQAVPADILTYDPDLLIEYERTRVDTARLLPEVSAIEHGSVQMPKAIRGGKPVDEFGLGTGGFGIDGRDMIRSPQFRMFDPDRSPVRIDEDGIDSITGPDATLTQKPAGGQVIEVLR